MTYSYAHHAETVEKVTALFRKEPGVLALLLGGSLAHGYAKENSDVDIMIVVTKKKVYKAEGKRFAAVFQ